MADLSNAPPRTAEQIRDRIDTGATGEKVDWSDPAASPLGTDAKAGGHAPTGDEIEMDHENASTNQATPRRFALGAVIAYGLIACGLLAGFAAIVVSN